MYCECVRAYMDTNTAHTTPVQFHAWDVHCFVSILCIDMYFLPTRLNNLYLLLN